MAMVVKNGEYDLKCLIGSGSFGKTYIGQHKKSGKQVAVKIEEGEDEQLTNEAEVYRALQGVPGVPQMIWFGIEGNSAIMIMDLLGPTLEDVFHFCGRKFALSTVLKLAVRLITIIEGVHNHDYIHQDIKPDNFCMGLRDNDIATMSVIDFGLAKKYRIRGGRHIAYNEKQSGATGTKAYMSLNAMRGVVQSRRDDLESLGYLFVYLMKGSLPWSGLKTDASLSEPDLELLAMKASIQPKQLCKGLPPVFLKFLNYAQELEFDEDPDYDHMRSLFEEQLEKVPEADSPFDWVVARQDGGLRALGNGRVKKLTRQTSSMERSKENDSSSPQETTWVQVMSRKRQREEEDRVQAVRSRLRPR